MRELDALLIEGQKTPGIVLMKRAARAVFAVLQARFAHGSVTVLCGAGNNAGDGYAVAALAAQAQRDVQVLYVTPPDQLQGDARRAYEYACQENVKMLPYNTGAARHLPDGCAIVDALVGTGLNGELRANLQDVIREINATTLPIIAIDVPSGLCANTGRTLGETIRAQATVTFIGCKAGLLTGRAPAFTGDIYFDALGAPRHLYSAFPPVAIRVDGDALKRFLPRKAADAHKGDAGHVLVVGGDLGMGGAAILCAEAAHASGAGLVTLATRAEHVMPALVRRPEVMALAVMRGQEVSACLERATVVALGPGLGQKAWGQALMQSVLASSLPLVIDADGLNLLADQFQVLPARGNWVLTPHPGEAARLLHTNTAVIQQNRYEAAQEIQRQYGGVVVLKGAGTVICDGDTTWVAKVGNPGLATAGSGDVLTGLLAAFIAQGLPLAIAANLAVVMHGEAGDELAKTYGHHGLAAADLPSCLRLLLK